MFWSAVVVLVHVAVIVRALLLEGRDPYSRLAWVLALMLFPVVSIVAYLMVGEPWVSGRFRRQAARAYRMLVGLQPQLPEHTSLESLPPAYRNPFMMASRLSAFQVVGGNRILLARDSNDAVRMLCRDINGATGRVYLTTYIWLTDGNGLAVVEALVRAARRGVVCRVCADAIGSRLMIRSQHWQRMMDAGVALCPSLRVPRGLRIVAGHRIDLRNHRKLVTIDGRISYIGSQNLADPEFRIKPKYAPWVDIMLRVEGPVTAQNDILFASDWAVEKGEDLSGEMRGRPVDQPGHVQAVVFGTGPMSRRGAMSTAFATLLYAAQDEVIISTPYFVPDPPLLSAIMACARRGVRTSLILPRRNDSRVIGSISKAFYPQLVDAGAQLFEYEPGLLHAKTMVVDGSLCLVGSSNMDRRSLDLNFENNLLFYSPPDAADIRARQLAYLADSRPVDPAWVRSRPAIKRLTDNILTMVGAVF